LFGIMLTRAPVGRRVLDNTLRARIGAFVIGGGVFVVLTVFLAGALGGGRIDNQAATATAAIGESLFRVYVLPFEAVSVLLLAALIGAIVLARRDRRTPRWHTRYLACPSAGRWPDAACFPADLRVVPVRRGGVRGPGAAERGDGAD